MKQETIENKYPFVSGNDLKIGQIVRSTMNIFYKYKVIKKTKKKIYTQCFPNTSNSNIWKTDINKIMWVILK